jgi:hypothetical protein
LKAVEKWGVGAKEVRKSNGRVEWTRVKYTHSGHTLRHPLKINLNINNEKQDCKIGTMCVDGY